MTHIRAQLNARKELSELKVTDLERQCDRNETPFDDAIHNEDKKFSTS
jgi:chaperonin cofactor prefoldin